MNQQYLPPVTTLQVGAAWEARHRRVIVACATRDCRVGVVLVTRTRRVNDAYLSRRCRVADRNRRVCAAIDVIARTALHILNIRRFHYSSARG